MPQAELPTIWAVILASTEVETTLGCVHSLLSCDYSSLEILVVASGPAVAALPTALVDRHPRVSALSIPQNLGASYGRNVALRAVAAHQPDYVLLLDNDTEVASDFLSQLVTVAEGRPEIGMLGATVLYANEREVVWTAGGRLYDDGRTVSLYHNEPVANVPSSPYEVDWIPSCALLAKWDAILAAGPFDEGLFVYFEDTEWCVRARERGVRLTQVPQAHVYHQVSRSQGGPQAPSKLYYMTRNRLWFERRYARRRKRMPRVLLAELRAAGGEFARGRPHHGRARLRAVAHFVRRRRGAML